MQRFGVVTVAYQFVGHLLRLQFRTTEDDGKNAWIVVYQSLQRQILVLRIHHIIDVVHVLGPFVARAHHNFLVVVQITLGNALYLLAHRGGEEAA